MCETSGYWPAWKYEILTPKETLHSTSLSVYRNCLHNVQRDILQQAAYDLGSKLGDMSFLGDPASFMIGVRRGSPSRWRQSSWKMEGIVLKLTIAV